MIEYKRDFLVFFIGCLLLVGFVLANSVFYAITSFYIYTLVVVFYYIKPTVLDPRVFCTLFITFYSTFYSINAFFFDYSFVVPFNESFALESLYYSYVFLFFFVTFFSMTGWVFKYNKSGVKSKFYASLSSSYTNKSEKHVFYFLIAFYLVSIFLGYSSDAVDKIDTNTSLVKIVSNYLVYMITALFIFNVISGGKVNYFVVVLFLIGVALPYLLVLGERDFVFRAVFLFLMYYLDKNNINSLRTVLLLVVVVVVVIPFSQQFKAFMLSPGFELSAFTVETVFSNEFVSAGRNFYTLLYYDVKEQGLTMILKELYRGVFPSFVFPGIDLKSSTEWFHLLRVEHGISGRSGWGFTLVGLGYLSSGLLGVILVSFIFSVVLSFSFSSRYKSKYWFVFYLLTLSTSIYVVRADLANFISQTIKLGGLSLISLYFIHRVMVRLKG